MSLYLDMAVAEGYKSNSQKIRVATEHWIGEHGYCPYCANEYLSHFENNRPVADFFCEKCHNEYELKSKAGAFGRKIADGAYETMIERITSDTNPDLFIMSYDKEDYQVRDLIMIPKFFFVPSVIEMRKPLAETARRAGWVGCNILLSEIPEQVYVPIVKEGELVDREIVVQKSKKNTLLKTKHANMRGWLLDTLKCIEKIDSKEFDIKDIYAFEDMLKVKYPENNNIRAKLRQQLQFLRDKEVIEFVSRGRYRKL